MTESKPKRRKPGFSARGDFESAKEFAVAEINRARDEQRARTERLRALRLQALEKKVDLEIPEN